jgi:hypothetical protein
MPALLMFSSTSTHCQILSLHLALTQGIILRLCTRSYLHRGRVAQGHEAKGMRNLFHFTAADPFIR